MDEPKFNIGEAVYINPPMSYLRDHKAVVKKIKLSDAGYIYTVEYTHVWGNTPKAKKDRLHESFLSKIKSSNG